MTVEEAAAQAKVSTKSWRVIEQGDSMPSLLMLGSVCRALKWTSETVESLLSGELRVEEGEVVVDLGDSRSDEPGGVEREPVEPEPQPAIPLDVEGLTRRQLEAVQEYIDDLRGFPRSDD
jgi:DNA-binding XRE family transcriptional regulator